VNEIKHSKALSAALTLQALDSTVHTFARKRAFTSLAPARLA
jgi:hypothetical protein